MKLLLTRLLIALGLISFFEGSSNHFIVHAKESSSASSAEASNTMGGRTGGCGKCQ